MSTHEHTTKRCTQCQQDLPATTEYFYRQTQNKDGLQCECKRCSRQRHKDSSYYVPHPRVKRQPKVDIRSLAHNERALYRQLERETTREERKAHEKAVDHAYYLANREKIMERAMTQYWAVAEDNKRVAAERKAERDAARAIKKAEEAANKPARHRLTEEEKAERNRAGVRRWAQEHPDRIRSKNRARRHQETAASKGIEGKFSAADIDEQIKAQTDKKGRLRCWWCAEVITGEYDLDHALPLARGGTNAASNIVISCKRCNNQKATKTPAEWKGRLF